MHFFPLKRTHDGERWGGFKRISARKIYFLVRNRLFLTHLGSKSTSGRKYYQSTTYLSKVLPKYYRTTLVTCYAFCYYVTLFPSNSTTVVPKVLRLVTLATCQQGAALPVTNGNIYPDSRMKISRNTQI